MVIPRLTFTPEYVIGKVKVSSSMSTGEGTEAIKTPSRRERAFIGQLSSDFLRVESATTANPSINPSTG